MALDLIAWVHSRGIFQELTGGAAAIVCQI